MDGDHVYCIRGISRFPDIDNYVTFVWLLKTYQIDRTGAGLFDLTLTQLDVNTQLYLRRTFGFVFIFIDCDRLFPFLGLLTT